MVPKTQKKNHIQLKLWVDCSTYIVNRYILIPLEQTQLESKRIKKIYLIYSGYYSDLRQSRQSLAMQSDRISRNSHHQHAPTHSITSSTRRSRPRSRSRDHHRGSSRYSTGGSTHTLNNYCDNSDNWTDHDMDIYMARNPTTRNGLVPL